MPPLSKEAYCFAPVGRLVGLAVCILNDVRTISFTPLFERCQYWYCVVTRAKPALGPNRYHTVRTQSGLSPCVRGQGQG